MSKANKEQRARGPLVQVKEALGLGRASARIRHMRPTHFLKRGDLWVPDPRSYKMVDDDEIARSKVDWWNLITNAGRIQLHRQGYDVSGLAANGFNYIALSNDTVTETAASTTLSNEIASNGLTRAQGTVTLPTGSNNQTTIDKTFTASGAQSAQKAALFNASSTGTMNHVLPFTQRALVTNDTLQITYTITLG